MAELSARSVVALSPHARFYRSEDKYILSTLKADYVFANRSAEIFDKTKFLLDGSMSLENIGQAINIPLTELITAFDVLIKDDDTLRDITALTEANSAENFLPLYFELCDRWAADIFNYPFWETIMSGYAAPPLVFGWGIEFYHRVMGADVHNALALNFCNDTRLRGWLAEHFAEEANHGVIFLDGLVASGFERETVLASAPLPATNTLINYLNALATTDIISYLGCYGVMHSPRVGQTRERIDNQFDYLKSKYDFAYPLLDKIHEHAAVDIDLGHDEIIFERFIRLQKDINRTTIFKCLGVIRGIVVAFVNFFANIYDYYNAPLVRIPRCFNSAEVILD